jgi:hypothetical protein
MLPDCPELAAFARGELDAASFPHREHVRMAFEMLRRHDFVTTAQRYSQALRLMSSRAGRPQAFNQTLTIAFLSVIAERLEGAAGCADFAAFLTARPRGAAETHRAEQLQAVRACITRVGGDQRCVSVPLNSSC